MSWDYTNMVAAMVGQGSVNPIINFTYMGLTETATIAHHASGWQLYVYNPEMSPEFAAAIANLETQTNTSITSIAHNGNGYIYFGEPNYPTTGAGISLTQVGISNLTVCDKIKDTHGNTWWAVEVGDNNTYSGGGNVRVQSPTGSAGLSGGSGWSTAVVTIPPNAV